MIGIICTTCLQMRNSFSSFRVSADQESFLFIKESIASLIISNSCMKLDGFSIQCRRRSVSNELGGACLFSLLVLYFSFIASRRISSVASRAFQIILVLKSSEKRRKEESIKGTSLRSYINPRELQLLEVYHEGLMMISNSREKELLSKQEASSKDAKALANSRSWSGLKDPRIVRVSRLFGGKDRHSKVSTVRGLRDRRVRLSVPTAIQLYDLQDRLGLNQPSKVVDWLLKAAQHEIDKLPPLQMPPENLVHFPQTLSMATREATPTRAPIFRDSESVCGYRAPPLAASSTKRSNVLEELGAMAKSTLWTKQKEAARESSSIDKANIMEGNEEENQDVSVGTGIHNNSQVPILGTLPRSIHPSLAGILHNVMPYTSFYHYDPSSALGNHSSQDEPPHSYNPTSSILSSPYIVPSLLPPFAISQNEFNSREPSDYFQMPNSNSGTHQPGSSTVRYFHTNLVPK